MSEFKLKYSPMQEAVKEGNLEFVRQNLDPEDKSFFNCAVKYQQTEIFEYAFPLVSLSAQRKALWDVAYIGREDYLDFALKHISIDPADTSPHNLACKAGHFNMVKRLESLGMQRDAYSFKSCLGSNNIELIEHVYRPGDDILNFFQHQTHYVELATLKFMMSHAELSSDHLHSVMLGAAAGGLTDVIDFLLLKGVSAEGCLFETVYFGAQLPTMQHLLESAPIKSSIAEHDYQAFIWAYEKGYIDFVDYLVNMHNIGPNSSPDIMHSMQKDNLELYHKVLSIEKSRKEKSQLDNMVLAVKPSTISKI